MTAGAVAVLAFAAACGGGNGYGGGSISTGSGSGSNGGLETTSTSLGTVLTDSAGKSLYGFAADSKGTSNCTGSCLTYWPPVPVEGSLPKDPAGVTAKVGEITRSDGSKQLTINGWPMYTYVGDAAQGDTTGQGLNLSGGLWWVVDTKGVWVTSTTRSSSGGTSSSGGSTAGGYTRGGY